MERILKNLFCLTKTEKNQTKNKGVPVKELPLYRKLWLALKCDFVYNQNEYLAVGFD